LGALQIVKLYKALINAAQPLLQVANKIYMPWSKKRIDQDICEQIRAKIQVGDIVLTQTYGEFTNLIIPSEWKHAAIFAHPNYLIEATQPFVKRTKWYDFFMHKDAVCVLRLKGVDEITRSLVARQATTYEGMPYDLQVEIGPKAYYCSELVYTAAKTVIPDWGFELRNRLGVDTVSPDDFRKARFHFDVVYLYDK